jgi:type I restriction enzyme S subunit
VPESALLADGDLVVAMDGDFQIQRWGRGPAALNQRLCRLRARGENDLRFLEYALPAHLNYINATQYATTVKHLSSGEILSSRVPLPPVEDQRRIADFLDDQTRRIRGIIEGRSRQIALLNETVAAVAWSAVTGRSVAGERREHGGSWVESLPSSWSMPRISQVARMGTGHTPSRGNPEYWLDCQIPWLTTADVHKFRFDQVETLHDTEFHISELGLENSAAVLHPAGTVALSRTASAGFAVMMGADMATSQDFATWTPGPMLRSDFLLWCLRAMRPDLLGRLAMGSTHKTIYFPDLMAIRIPLPSRAEQKSATEEIAEAVSHARVTTDALQQSIARLDELKSSLVTAVMLGEIDIDTASGRGVTP